MKCKHKNLRMRARDGSECQVMCLSAQGGVTHFVVMYPDLLWLRCERCRFHLGLAVERARQDVIYASNKLEGL